LKGITRKDGARPAQPKLVNFLLLCMSNFVIVMYVTFSVFCVLFVCKGELCCSNRVSTQLQLNIYINIANICCNIKVVPSSSPDPKIYSKM
jgi:hypothetical protein